MTTEALGASLQARQAVAEGSARASPFGLGKPAVMLGFVLFGAV